MKTAAVSELRARLSEFLGQVKAGSEVLITDRGRPVARLVPISGASTVKDSLSTLEKQGLIKIGSGKLPKNFWRMPRAQDRRGLVLKALIEERQADAPFESPFDRLTVLSNVEGLTVPREIEGVACPAGKQEIPRLTQLAGKPPSLHIRQAHVVPLYKGEEVRKGRGFGIGERTPNQSGVLRVCGGAEEVL